MSTTRRGLLAAGFVGVTGSLGVLRPTNRACPEAGTGEARLGFVGDVMLGRRVSDRWRGAEPAGVWGSTLDRLQGFDGLVVNLECCLSDRAEQWREKTHHFRADPAFAVPALAAADVSVAALGNNQVLDFGKPALADTIAHLADADVADAGAGSDRQAALAPAVVDVNGLQVAVVSLTDRFSAFGATDDSAETADARLDSRSHSTRKLVCETAERARTLDPDLIVASLHWTSNWETAPADAQQAFARWLVDRGVDVLHGHSAHVLQGVEIHRGRPIVYDAGDFVDDYSPRDGLHDKRSATFEVRVADGRLDELRVLPIEIRNEAATMAEGEVAAWVRETMRERSAPFGTTFDPAGDALSVPLGDC